MKGLRTMKLHPIYEIICEDYDPNEVFQHRGYSPEKAIKEWAKEFDEQDHHGIIVHKEHTVVKCRRMGTKKWKMYEVTGGIMYYYKTLLVEI